MQDLILRTRSEIAIGTSKSRNQTLVKIRDRYLMPFIPSTDAKKVGEVNLDRHSEFLRPRDGHLDSS